MQTEPGTSTQSQIPDRSVAKIAEALAKAQAKITQPHKNKTVTVKDRDGKRLYDFEYADYNAIVEAVRIPLSENGICFTHLIERAGAGLVLVTRLIHSSGEFLESLYPLPGSSDPKALGGAVTYGKRYCLSAITGCVADDDTDGAETTTPGKTTTDFKDRDPKTKTENPKVGSGPVIKAKTQGTTVEATLPSDHPTVNQLGRLFAIAKGKHPDETRWTEDHIKLFISHRWGLESTKDLTIAQYEELVETIQSKTFTWAMNAVRPEPMNFGDVP